MGSAPPSMGTAVRWQWLRAAAPVARQPAFPRRANGPRSARGAVGSRAYEARLAAGTESAQVASDRRAGRLAREEKSMARVVGYSMILAAVAATGCAHHSSVADDQVAAIAEYKLSLEDVV